MNIEKLWDTMSFIQDTLVRVENTRDPAVLPDLERAVNRTKALSSGPAERRNVPYTAQVLRPLLLRERKVSNLRSPRSGRP
jgi:hypothetical protein